MKKSKEEQGLLAKLASEYYPSWEPPVSRLRATRKWYFPS